MDMDAPFSCLTTIYGIRDRGVLDEEKGRICPKQHQHHTTNSTERIRDHNYPPSTTRRRVENQPPNLTKHQTSQPQYMRGSCAPFKYAHDRKRNWVVRFLVRQRFTVSEVEKYATERRSRREGYGRNNKEHHQHQHQHQHQQFRTYLQEYDYPLSTTRQHVENQPPNLTKHQILQPQYVRGSCALSYTPTIANGFGCSVFLPDNSLRY